jgi:hypothetical protein
MYYQPFYSVYNEITYRNDIIKINFFVKSTSQDNARKQLQKKMIDHPDYNNWIINGMNLFNAPSKD